MRAARFRVADELLRRVLHMPEGAVIVGARMDDMGIIELVATDPSLPDANEPHACEPIVREREASWDWNLQGDTE